MRNYQNRNEQRKSVECRSELTSVTMLGLIFREIVFSVTLFEIYLVLCELGTSKVSYQSDTANALEFSNFKVENRVRARKFGWAKLHLVEFFFLIFLKKGI